MPPRHAPKAKPAVEQPRLPILPRHSERGRRRSPLEHAREYYRTKIRAPFLSPLAGEYEFETEDEIAMDFYTASGDDLVSMIGFELQNLSLYFSRLMSAPHYGKDNEIGFVRGDTLEPVGLREVGYGYWHFRVKGLAVGRKDLLKLLDGPNHQGPKPPDSLKAVRDGWNRVFVCMPAKPDAREVDGEEWYYFRPRKWLKDHPSIPLKLVPIRIRPRAEAMPAIAPQFDRMYKDGVIRLAFLFGYDADTHLASDDAKAIYDVLTSPTTSQFTEKDTGPYGYHGPGLSFSDPTRGKFDELNLNGTSVFRRDSASGAGPIVVTYRLESESLPVGTPGARSGTVKVRDRVVPDGTVIPKGTLITRQIAAEVRLYNFDKTAGRVTSEQLIERFVSVFGANDFIHYDGHANYGGGFYIGEQPNDLLWAADIGQYEELFSSSYQIFSIGACHGAGYFADLFYNELAPRKSPRNLDIIAAVNETAFDDAVQVGVELISALLQLKSATGQEPEDYATIIRRLSRPESFHAYTGVFGHPRA